MVRMASECVTTALARDRANCSATRKERSIHGPAFAPLWAVAVCSIVCVKSKTDGRLPRTAAMVDGKECA